METAGISRQTKNIEAQATAELFLSCKFKMEDQRSWTSPSERGSIWGRDNL